MKSNTWAAASFATFLFLGCELGSCRKLAQAPSAGQGSDITYADQLLTALNGNASESGKSRDARRARRPRILSSIVKIFQLGSLVLWSV